jgi:hypothetical protein
LEPLGIPVETGVFKDEAPENISWSCLWQTLSTFMQITLPACDVQEARISLYAKGSYYQREKTIVRALLGADFTITDRRYIGYETETGYHHYNVDVAKHYEMEE